MSSLRRVAIGLARLPSRAIIGAVRVYQRWISPSLGPTCRFEPTCSQYMVGAVEKYGPVVGAAKGCWRICRCHPWHPGGWDPP